MQKKTNQDTFGFGALRTPNYLYYWLGWTFLVAGQAIQIASLEWEIYERFRDPVLVGGLRAAYAIPLTLLTIYAGKTAEVSQRKVMTVSRSIFFAATLGISLISYGSNPQIWLIYLCLLLSGCAIAFHNPANDALLPKIISEELRGNAIAWNRLGYLIASIGAPILAGYINASQGQASVSYFIGSGFLLLSVLLIFPVRGKFDETPTTLSTSASSSNKSNKWAGFQFLLTDTPLLAAMSLDMAATLFGGSYALMPIFAKDILRVGAAELGWMQAAPSIGSLCMTYALVRMPNFRKDGNTLLGVVAGFGFSIVVFGFSRTFILALIALFLSGCFDAISVVIRHTMRYARTPNYLIGRVSAADHLFRGLGNGFSTIQSGWAVNLMGAVAATVTGGIGTIAFVLLVAYLLPEVRHEKR